MKSVNDLPVPQIRLLVQDIQEALWWDDELKAWNRHKTWPRPCGLPILKRIAEVMACSDLRPEEGHVELS